MFIWVAQALAWIGGLAAAAWTAVVSLFVSMVVAMGTVDMILRVLRITIVLAATLWLVNQVPIPGGSLTGLWNTYAGDASSVLATVGYFVPISLLFTLIDLYIAAVLVLLAIRAVKYVSAAGR